MYAITFDFEIETLKRTYRNPSYNNAYSDVRKVLTEEYGFSWTQGSVYFGDESVDAVVCVMAVQDLKARFNWFEPSVRDIRMLRIDEDNDLGPALGRGGAKRRARPRAA
ncbi:virulence factor [Stenotrophomonas maltophilia]|nr:virulence factor [Stenotrophomonas maltophilia]